MRDERNATLFGASSNALLPNVSITPCLFFHEIQRRRNIGMLADFKRAHWYALSLSGVELVAHAVLDVVVDDEVQLLFREAVVLRQQFVDLVDDGL